MAQLPPHDRRGAPARRELPPVPPRPPSRHAAIAHTHPPAAGQQSAHGGPGRATAGRPRTGRRRHPGPGGRGAAAAAHRRLHLHAGARRVWRTHGRRILVRPQGGFLRAHCLGVRGADAGRWRARAHRHRLPGGRAQPGRRLLVCAPERRPCLVRSLDGGTRLGARGPHGRRLTGACWGLPAPAGPARRPGNRGGHGDQPRHGTAPARRMGSGQQQLEPVGAELHPEPPARPAARPGL